MAELREGDEGESVCMYVSRRGGGEEVGRGSKVEEEFTNGIHHFSCAEVTSLRQPISLR